MIDPTGLPVAAATVRLTPAAGAAAPRSLTTDARGRFRLTGASAGVWTLEVHAEGFEPRQLTLDTGGNRRLEIRLAVAAPPLPEAPLLDVVRRADGMFAAAEWTAARAAYEEALRLRPRNSLTLHLQIARCLGHEGDYAGELEHLQLRLDAEPDNALLRALMAQEAARGGMLSRGLALLDGLDGAAARDPQVFFGVAAILLNQGQAEAALPLLDRTLAVAPDFPEGLLQRGLVLLRQRRFDDARRDLARLLALQPEHPQAELLRQTLGDLPRR